MRAAARRIFQKRKFDRISDDIREKLHWLPVQQRIIYKLYLSEMLSSAADNPYLRSHRSAAHGDLLIPRMRTKTLGPRSFAVSGPTA